MSLQEVRVFVEATNENVVIALSEQELIRAQQDSSFLQDHIDKYYEDKARAIQETELAAETEQSSQNLERQELDHVHDDSSDAGKAYIWSDACIFLLLATFEENKENFQRQRHKKVYNAIASHMRDHNVNYTMTGGQCQSKINSLKKTYKKIKDHNSKSGNDTANWPYFNRMDEIFGSTGWANPVAVASEAGPACASASISEASSPRSPEASTSGTPIQTSTKQQKKRRLDSVLERSIEEKKQMRIERARAKQQNFDKLIELKKQQHEEKMDILKCILNAMNR